MVGLRKKLYDRRECVCEFKRGEGEEGRRREEE